MIVLSLFAALAPSAHAQSEGGALQALVGTASAFDGDPASLRLSVRGEVGIDEGGILGGSLLLPVTITTEGEDAVGFSGRQTLVELPLSVRGRLFPASPVRLYGDAGAGVAIGTSVVEGWLLERSDSAAVFMTRLAVGAEFGSPDGLSFVIEPASWATYFGSEDVRAQWGLMLGLSTDL